jgi:poly-beta-1,6-N-acetyl-D-glucosamine synthase
MIIAAYNEAPYLQQKLENTLSIDYPRELLQIIFVTDGSTDGSENVITGIKGVEVSHQGKREGKLAAINRIMRGVKNHYIVFSDANTMLNKECLKKMMMHYVDGKTGGVAGEKKIIRDRSAIGEAEGLYWKYESFMKQQDASFHTVVGAAGELFSIRRDLFEPPDDGFILDDFVISMKICLKGYKIKYEPGAFATEFPSASLQEEAKRKIRISAGAYQSIGYLRDCLNFFKHPLLSFQFISRRLLRWVFCPPLLVLLFFTNLFIVVAHTAPLLYTSIFFVQVLFYLLAFIGWRQLRAGRSIGILAVPFYFVFMNYCLCRGFIRFVKKDQTVLWEKSLRQA